MLLEFGHDIYKETFPTPRIKNFGMGQKVQIEFQLRKMYLRNQSKQV